MKDDDPVFYKIRTKGLRWTSGYMMFHD